MASKGTSAGDPSMLSAIVKTIALTLDVEFANDERSRSVTCNTAGSISCHLVGNAAATWTKYVFLAGQSKPISIDQIRTHADTTVPTADIIVES